MTLETSSTLPTSRAPKVLIAAAALGPVWTTYLGVQQLSIGRLLTLALFVAVVLDLRGRDLSTLRPWRGVALLATGLLGLLAWTVLSAATVGCFCSGTAQGFFDLVAFTVVASVVALYVSPREAYLAIAAAAGGVLVAGLLSVAGFQDLHANAYTEGSSAARLEGVYGNSNFLGFALALAIPIAAYGTARLDGARRLGSAAATVALIVLLYMTFSRGSLIAAAAGVGVVLWVDVTRRAQRGVAYDARVAAGALIIPFLAVVLVVTPFYKDQRVRADFGAQVDAPAKVDSGGKRSDKFGKKKDHSGTRKEELHATEGKYIESRTTGMKLAAKAFAANPVLGIGLDEFPYYADAEAEFGELPTHNTYAQIAAELGGVGMLLFAFVGVTTLLALLRGRGPLPLRALIAGTVAVGVVNFVFINGLASTGMVMPLLLAIVFAAGWAGVREPAPAPAPDPESATA